MVPAALASHPDVALLDIEMPGTDGLSAAAQLRRAVPACRVAIVTTFGRPGYLRRAMEAGAAGFLLKDAPAQDLVRAIRRCAAGMSVIEPGLAIEALAEGANPLSTRECEVLAESARGGSIADIAAALTLSDGTVRNQFNIRILNERQNPVAYTIALDPASTPPGMRLIGAEDPVQVPSLGEVQKPGRYELRGRTTVLDALALAGGF